MYWRVCRHFNAVVGCGSNVVDRFFKIRALPKVGEKGFFNDPTKIHEGTVVGGVTLNHLAWASALGVPTALLARQGEDESGRQVRATMKDLNVSTEFLDVAPQNTTAESFIFSQPDGERTIIMASGSTSTITGEQADTLFRRAIEAAKIFSTELSQVPTSGVQQMITVAKQAAVICALDLDVSPSVAVEEAHLGDLQSVLECCKGVDILKPARHAAEELVALLDTSLDSATVAQLTTEELAQRTQLLTGSKLVAITSGAEGSSLAMDKISVTVPPRAIPKVVDATGAGDAYFGGLIASLWHFGAPWEEVSNDNQQQSLHRMGEIANTVGGRCCLSVGGLPPADFHLSELYQLNNVLEATLAFANIKAAPFSATPAATTTTASSTGRCPPISLASSFAIDAAVLTSNVARAEEESLREAIHCVTNAQHVYVTGVGKSGYVGRRLAASLTSINVPSTYVSASEWGHGDLGHVHHENVSKSNTCVIAISHSGETAEVLSALGALDACATTIGVTSNGDSRMAKECDIVIQYGLGGGGGGDGPNTTTDSLVEPLNGIPAASIIAQEAVVNAVMRGIASFTDPVVFKNNHPAGSLGNKFA